MMTSGSFFWKLKTFLTHSSVGTQRFHNFNPQKNPLSHWVPGAGSFLSTKHLSLWEPTVNMFSLLEREDMFVAKKAMFVFWNGIQILLTLVMCSTSQTKCLISQKIPFFWTLDFWGSKNPTNHMNQSQQQEPPELPTVRSSTKLSKSCLASSKQLPVSTGRFSLVGLWVENHGCH